MPDSETLAHIEAVRERIAQVVAELMIRAREHDASKLQESEREAFRAARGPLPPYGSPEYEAGLERLKDTLARHYAANRHHPQHWPNGVRDMTLIDVVEMLADWAASAQRNENPDLLKSLEHNRARFGLSDELYSILLNTALELGWG